MQVTGALWAVRINTQLSLLLSAEANGCFFGMPASLLAVCVVLKIQAGHPV